MTVEKLIKKFKNVPKDAVVTIRNDEMWVDGEYVVSGIDYDESTNTVEIYTDYTKRIR